jgi:cellulose biosynthesis protein BcsQ
MNIIDKIIEIGNCMNSDSTSLKEALLESTQVAVTDEDLPDGVSRLIYNHTITKTSLGEDIFRVSKSTYLKRITQAIDNGVISEPIFHNRSHLFTLAQVHQLMDHYEFEKFSDNYNSTVVGIKNYKGGTGKSTTTVTLAMATALDLDLNAKVCIVDLDPQGSAARGIINVQHEQDELFITIADLACAEHEQDGEVAQLLENGNLFEDIVRAAPFSTHIPNLDVVTAFPTDEKFTDLYWELNDKEKRDELLTYFARKVLPILKLEYDIIYLDLPPQNSPITWSAAEATDMIITPVTPRTYDYASTTSFMLTLADVLQSLPSKGENIKWLRVLPVNYSENNRQERKTFDRLLRAVGGHMFTTPIKHSPLFLEAASMNRTIFDIRKTESSCTALQYENACSSVKDVYRNFISELKVIAAK